MSGERKGRLKIYLGYAAGVGKTYRMLDEAQALRAGGADIVIAYFEAHGRRDTIAKTEGLETVPRRVVWRRTSAVWALYDGEPGDGRTANLVNLVTDGTFTTPTAECRETSRLS